VPALLSETKQVKMNLLKSRGEFPLRAMHFLREPEKVG
jgi:hypothetical protein